LKSDHDLDSTRRPMAYVDGLNAHVAMAENPINAINPLGT
jgi:hypothetical protein